jgi:hypothetical protein
VVRVKGIFGVSEGIALVRPESLLCPSMMRWYRDLEEVNQSEER